MIANYKSMKISHLNYLFIYVNVFCKGIGLGNDSIVYLLLMIFGLLVSVVPMIVKRHRKDEWLVMVMLILFSVLTFFATFIPTFTITVIVFVTFKGLNLDEVLKTMLYIRISTFILMISLAFLGIIENTEFYRYSLGVMENRYTLGFPHPNTLHASLVIIFALYICVKKGKLKITEYIILIISNQFIYSFSLSRTGILIGYLLIFSNILCEAIKKLKKKDWILYLPSITLVFSIFFSFITAFLHGKNFIVEILNQFLNNRILYSNYYLTNYGFTLFGNPNILQDANALFDNGYIYLYLQFGLLGTLSWLFIVYKSIQGVMYNKDYTKAIVMCCMFIFQITESFTPNIFINIILFFGADFFFSVKNEEYKNKSLLKIKY